MHTGVIWPRGDNMSKPWASVFILHCSSFQSCMNGYLAIHSGGYLCTNSLRALIATCRIFPREAEAVFVLIGLPIRNKV